MTNAAELKSNLIRKIEKLPVNRLQYLNDILLQETKESSLKKYLKKMPFNLEKAVIESEKEFAEGKTISLTKLKQHAKQWQRKSST